MPCPSDLKAALSYDSPRFAWERGYNDSGNMICALREARDKFLGFCIKFLSIRLTPGLKLRYEPSSVVYHSVLMIDMQRSAFDVLDDPILSLSIPLFFFIGLNPFGLFRLSHDYGIPDKGDDSGPGINGRRPGETVPARR